ncbi:LADA_0A02872g1_1 [Lachancea dasiensis]|uniref:LADA_0A02872g1_1 n=1 Tax=Lachancea dasiensis TaxID=1072105 RepID=A0A1G4IMQ0_9SACH|nr:LADA_0A02872g1_1 [Lachancea dasiensis]
MPPRRNKTSVACTNCSKAHVTCEAHRPCSRCVKKGIEQTCVDKPRKRKKYLADVPVEHLQGNSGQSNSFPDQLPYKTGGGAALGKPRFLSSAADLEYSILSDITQQDPLINKIPLDLLYSNNDATAAKEDRLSPSNSHSTASASAMLDPTATPLGYGTVVAPSVTSSVNSSTTILAQKSKFATLLGTRGREALQLDVDIFTSHFPLVPQEIGSPEMTLTPTSIDANVRQYHLNHRHPLSHTLERIVSADNKIVSLALDVTSQDQRAVQNFPDITHTLRYGTPMEIYTLISTPFSHTPGFHSLLQYLRSRFDRADIVEMCRSLAEFRPIFIAIAVTLTEEDMIFMEQCYQRTLLEYDQFISQIGTPTCIWRRNGQVSYVNDEFSLLTGWTRPDLLFKMTFIVELMDDESVREYFKTFNRVAYQDFNGSERMKTCKLLTPIRGREIECCCIWTLKRDVFGLPSMIIGNFMPILDGLQ